MILKGSDDLRLGSQYTKGKKKILKNLNLSLITSKVLFKTVTCPFGIARKSYHKKVSARQQVASVVAKTDFFFFKKKYYFTSED